MITFGLTGGGIVKRKDLVVVGVLIIFVMAVGLYYLPPVGRAVAVGALAIIFGLF